MCRRKFFMDMVDERVKQERDICTIESSCPLSHECLDCLQVMLLGLGVGGDGVGTIARQFSKVGDTGCIASPFTQMISKRCCHLFLLRRSMDGFDRFSRTLVQLCTSCSRKTAIQMTHDEGVPEMVGDLCIGD